MSDASRSLILGASLAWATIAPLHRSVHSAQAGVALVSGALVFLAAQDRGLILGAGAVRSLFIWVGARSYAIYLIHAPAFLAAREIWFRIGPQSSEIPVALTALALLLVGAELNWRLVERPLRAYGVRVADRFVMRREESISYVEPVGA